MKLKDLKTIHCEEPITIQETPYFSWKMESEQQNEKQEYYQLRVEKEDGSLMWDTGKVKDSRSTYVFYQGKELESRTLYRWWITVWNQHKTCATGESQFETAIMSEKEWRALWMKSSLPTRKRKPGFGNQPPATLFRKAFFLEKNVKKAKLYATCHGIYRLTMNGTRPDHREFAPEFSVYEKYLCYQTYDVTSLLQKGENVIGLYVGDGWYCGPKTQPPNIKRDTTHAVLFQMEVEYEDGSKDRIISDENVKIHYGPICCSDLFAGEEYDARLEEKGWDCPGYDDHEWVKAIRKDYGYDVLVSQIGEPVTGVIELPVKKVFVSPKGEHILDFGQVMAGRVRMHLNIPKGQKVILDHFETTDKEGNYFNSFERGMGKNCDQRDVYISDGTESTYEPYFTYHGFRYVRVQGLDEIKSEDFCAVVISTEMKSTGTFSCSDENLNRLYNNTIWSQRSNMVSIPTDCPQREKAGWTGDIMIYSETSLLNADTTLFLERWLENLSCDQGMKGEIPVVVPYTGIYPSFAKILGFLFGNKGIPASAGWGDAGVIVPLKMYQVTGNLMVLKRQYESMKKWCDYIIQTAHTQRNRKNRLPKEIDKWLWNTGFHFGEWLIPSLSKSGYGKNTYRSIFESLKYTAPVFGYYSVYSMAQIAEVLGKKVDADYYGSVAEKMKWAFGEGVIDKDGNMPIELMGAYVLPLYFDLVPDKYKPSFEEKLIRMIKENGGCLDTGFLATPFILETLCKIGRKDIAYELLFQTKAPSWLYGVIHGATSIWESWYAFDEEGNPFSISLNHYAFGCVVEWIFKNICGIVPLEPGYKKVMISLHMEPPVNYADRTFSTEFGELVCRWRKENRDFYLHIEIPCNTDAVVKLPDGSCYQVGSGSYDYCCPLLDRKVEKIKIK